MLLIFEFSVFKLMFFSLHYLHNLSLHRNNNNWSTNSIKASQPLIKMNPCAIFWTFLCFSV